MTSPNLQITVLQYGLNFRQADPDLTSRSASLRLSRSEFYLNHGHDGHAVVAPR